MTHKFHTFNAAGVQVGNPPPEASGRTPTDYAAKPVRVSVHRDGSIELHSKAFSASANLSIDEGLSVAMMLLFVCRDRLHAMQAQPTVMVDAR